MRSSMASMHTRASAGRRAGGHGRLRYGQPGVGELEGTGRTPPPRHLAAGATLAVIADVVPLVAAGALSIVLARTVGHAANGSFALVNTVLNVIVLIASLGLGAGLTYEVSHRGWP